jgi:hypothetical protein
LIYSPSLNIWYPSRMKKGKIPPSPPEETRTNRYKQMLKDCRSFSGKLPGWFAGLVNGGMVNSGHALVNAGAIRAATSGPPNDAAAYYKFEANGNDSTSGAHNLTATNGPTFNTGKIGNAAYLASASSQYFTAVDDAAFDMSASLFTIVEWFYSADVTATQGLVCKGFVAGALTDREYTTSIESSTYRFITGQNGAQQVVNSGAITSNAWNFAYATWDGVNIKVCANQGTVFSAAGIQPQHTALAFLIGREGRVAFPNYLNGRKDSTGLYKRVLTADEIALFWNGGSGADPTF